MSLQFPFYFDIGTLNRTDFSYPCTQVWYFLKIVWEYDP